MGSLISAEMPASEHCPVVLDSKQSWDLWWWSLCGSDDVREDVMMLDRVFFQKQCHLWPSLCITAWSTGNHARGIIGQPALSRPQQQKVEKKFSTARMWSNMGKQIPKMFLYRLSLSERRFSHRGKSKASAESFIEVEAWLDWKNKISSGIADSMQILLWDWYCHLA